MLNESDASASARYRTLVAHCGGVWLPPPPILPPMAPAPGQRFLPPEGAANHPPRWRPHQGPAPPPPPPQTHRSVPPRRTGATQRRIGRGLRRERARSRVPPRGYGRPSGGRGRHPPRVPRPVCRVRGLRPAPVGCARGHPGMGLATRRRPCLCRPG
jgi:hypothetical protein